MRSRRWSTRAGRILVTGLLPPPMPQSVRRALADIEPGEPDGPGDRSPLGRAGTDSPPSGSSAGTRSKCSAFRTGNPDRPVNAIPPRATAHLQLRFVAGCDWRTFVPVIRTHLDTRGFAKVDDAAVRLEPMAATRLDPDHPWVQWAAASIAATTGSRPAILPNLGGSLPNDCFADVLAIADDLGAAFLSRVLAARTRRAPAGRMSRARASAS